MSSFCIPMSLATEKLAMSASYSTSLFMALKPYFIACLMMSPSWEIRIILMPVPLVLLEPSTERVHFEARHSVMPSSSLLACARALGVKLAMKSVTIIRWWAWPSRYCDSTRERYLVHL